MERRIRHHRRQAARLAAQVGDGALKLDGMRVEVDPPQEWKEIFNEVWRQERDYFFEASMNGVDWQKTQDQYAQLLPYVADRYSLTYIMGEMIGGTIEFAHLCRRRRLSRCASGECRLAGRGL